MTNNSFQIHPSTHIAHVEYNVLNLADLVGILR